MFQDIFIQIHQDIEKLNAEFDHAQNIDEELYLLEKYLSLKELSEDLTYEIKSLTNKIKQFENQHGLDLEGSVNDTELGKEPESEKIVVELDENDFDAFQKGIGYYDLWMYDQALVNLTKVIKKYPDFNLARLYTGMTYFKKQDFNEAKRELLFVLNASDDSDLSSLSHNILGMIHSQNDNLEQAEEHFKASIGLKKNWNEPQFNLAVTLYKSNKLEEAKSIFEELYDKNSYDWEVVLYLGKTYQRLKEYSLANDFFKLTFFITKKPEVIKQITKHLEERGNIEQTMKWYEKWLEIDPENIDALYGVAKSHWLQGNIDKSILYLKKALTMDKNDLKSLLLYAWVLTEIDDKKAISIINRLAKKNEGSQLANYYLTGHLARLYYLNKNYKMAKTFCSLLLDSEHESIKSLGHIVKGLIYLDINEPDKAVSHFGLVSEQKFPYLNFFLGYSYYLLGENSKAEEYWNGLVIHE